jgi:hypothetical protein
MIVTLHRTLQRIWCCESATNRLISTSILPKLVRCHLWREANLSPGWARRSRPHRRRSGLCCSGETGLGTDRPPQVRLLRLGGGLVVKEPKTAAGVRPIALPRSLMPEIARHLDRFAEIGPDGRAFVGPYGVTPTGRTFGRIWARAKKAVGDVVPADLHFHDLRHSGNHFAASSGAMEVIPRPSANVRRRVERRIEGDCW